MLFAMSISHDDAAPLARSIAAVPARPRQTSQQPQATTKSAAQPVQQQQQDNAAAQAQLPHMALMEALRAATAEPAGESTCACRQQRFASLFTQPPTMLTHCRPPFFNTGSDNMARHSGEFAMWGTSPTGGPGSDAAGHACSWDLLSTSSSPMLHDNMMRCNSSPSTHAYAHQHLMLPSASLPVLPILISKPGNYAAMAGPGSAPVLAPLSGASIASSVPFEQFPIAAAAAQSASSTSLRVRPLAGSDLLHGTCSPPGLGALASAYDIMRQAAYPEGDAEECLDAAAEHLAFLPEDRAAGDATASTSKAALATSQRSSGASGQPQRLPEAAAAKAAAALGGAATQAQPGRGAAASSVRGPAVSCGFWKGLAAAAAAVDGNVVRQPVRDGLRGAAAETSIPWVSPAAGLAGCH